MLNDLRFAVRWLRRSPGFALVAIASLALGIGFNTALFSFVDAVLFRPLPVRGVDRLVDLYTNSPDGDRYATSSYPDYLDLKAASTVFDDMIGYSPAFAILSGGDRSRLALGEVVTGNYFQVLGLNASLGRTLLPEDDTPTAPPVAMVSHAFWKRELGGDAAAIGRTLRIRGDDYTVVGVAPAGFGGLTPVIAAELWVPLSRVTEVEPVGMQDSVPSPAGMSRLDRRGQRWMLLKGRLKPGATVEQASAEMSVLMQRLFRTLGIPLLQGRAFSEADTPDTPGVVIVNETMARRYWPGENPLGRRLRLRGPEGPSFEIVGIVADHRVQTVGEAAAPYVHFAYSQRPTGYQTLIARTAGDAGLLLAAIRRELLALEPRSAFLENQTMEMQVQATLLPAKAAVWVVSVVAAVGMLLAAIGLYGVIAYSVGRRVREIGIRMALGATGAQVLGSVMRRGLTVAVVGLAAGSLLAALGARAVAGVLYSISPADPVAWGLALTLLLAVSAGANLLPARRAARIDPSVALRSE